MPESANRFARRFAMIATAGALLHGAPAWAVTSRAWVAYFGTDSAACGSLAAPCRSLQQALTNVAAGGDVSLLTPIDSNSVLVIGKAVNITNDGAGEAGFSGQVSIDVEAGAGDVISLRGLVMDGQGFAGQAGLVIRSASAVHVQNCVIRNSESQPSGFGIFLAPSGNTRLFVSDTIIYNNGSGAGTGGILIRPGNAGSANVLLDRVHLENNVLGLWVNGLDSSGNGAHVVVRDSVVSGNAADGILATSAPGKAPAFIVVERTSAADNGGTGIKADGPQATILLNDNTITRNGTGISAVNGGQLISYGNNRNNNNVGPEGAPTGLLSLM